MVPKSASQVAKANPCPTHPRRMASLQVGPPFGELAFGRASIPSLAASGDGGLGISVGGTLPALLRRAASYLLGQDHPGVTSVKKRKKEPHTLFFIIIIGTIGGEMEMISLDDEVCLMNQFFSIYYALLLYYSGVIDNSVFVG
ncbi:hypothetical protein JTE90_026285 [Oedothorax gibbosus]|uniref:Uncharacterized protein n=1 Tax=Oedothorax gibbosus TaxID=931172 RepID=A0AAV6U2R0_9ARAC|nr:hypothetical protein JTE90_026285 [Oedothorax gibbosus]